MNQKPEARLFVAATLSAGEMIELSSDQAHYLKSVLRLKAGASIALFNGKDGEFSARIASFTRNSGTVVLEKQSREQATEPDLWLIFAPIKHARIDFLVEKATELGV